MKSILTIILSSSTYVVLIAQQQATLSGRYDMLSSKPWVINNPCIEILGQPDAEITRFHVSFSGVEMWEGPYMRQDSCLNNKAIQMIYQLSRGTKIYFEDIIAYDANGLLLEISGFYIRIE